jgi:tRNA threonylcarbamoyladenosine biosynthesis protein TsaE
MARMPGRSHALVIALEGELGAGKTTFSQAFAKELGIVQALKSPTFMLVKEYPIPNTHHSLWHLDCYRLNGPADLGAMDMAHVFADPRNIVLVEWAQRVLPALPPDHMTIHFAHHGHDVRSIAITEPTHA